MVYDEKRRALRRKKDDGNISTREAGQSNASEKMVG